MLTLTLFINARLNLPFIIPSFFLFILVYCIFGFLGLLRHLKIDNKNKNYSYMKGVFLCQGMFLIALIIFSLAYTTLNYFYGQGYDNWFATFFHKIEANFALPLIISFLVPILFSFKNQNQEIVSDDILGNL